MIYTVHVVRLYVIMFLYDVLAYFSCPCIPWHIQNLFVKASAADSFYVVQFYKFVLGECMKPAYVCITSKFGLYWKGLHTRKWTACLVVRYLKNLLWKCK